MISRTITSCTSLWSQLISVQVSLLPTTLLSRMSLRDQGVKGCNNSAIYKKIMRSTVDGHIPSRSESASPPGNSEGTRAASPAFPVPAGHSGTARQI